MTTSSKDPRADLLALLDGLEIENVDQEAVANGLRSHFEDTPDLVFAIALCNNPTEIREASGKLLSREQSKQLLAAAREDRANELELLATASKTQAGPLLGTAAAPLVIQKSYREMSEADLIRELAKEGKYGPNTTAVMLEIETRPLINGHTIFVPLPDTDLERLDAEASIAAFGSMLATGSAPQNWGEQQVATLTLHEYVFGGILADPLTHEALENGISPSSRAHWSLLSRDRLVLVAFADQNGYELPPARTIVDELQGDKPLNEFWLAVQAQFQKAQVHAQEKVAMAWAALLFKREDPRSARSFR